MIIAPSVLSLSYDKFNEQVADLNSCVDWLHYDVMDGNFVPNITFGPDILKTFRRNSSLFLDVHLMVNDPGYYSEVFAKAGADGITFHYESYNDIDKCRQLIDKIHSMYIKAGISIRPGTDVNVILPLLNEVDLVLIMSVEPGFGGQKFQPESLNRIKILDNYRKENNLHYIIEDDGGVNDKNAYDLINAGCDALVAGSFVFNGNIQNNVKLLRNIEKSI